MQSALHTAHSVPDARLLRAPVRQVQCREVEALLEAQEDVGLQLALLIHHDIVVPPVVAAVGDSEGGRQWQTAVDITDDTTAQLSGA
jgi:hypothetical protein